MSAPLLSVLVVSHNRPHKLQRVLRDLSQQDLDADAFEVIVTDDGSSPSMAPLLAPFKDALDLTLVEGPQAGPAAARNRGLHRVNAPLLLLLNDDVWCEPSLLQRHLDMQGARPSATALMGTFAFPPSLLDDPFHLALEEAGLIGTAQMNPGVPLAPTMCWTGNLSIATQSMRDVGGFDESFGEPKGEDVDLGYRLAQRGVDLRYTRKAVAWHDHRHSLDDWWRRAAMIGRALLKLAVKHMDPLFWPGGVIRSDPHSANMAYRRLMAQSAAAAELQAWIEQLLQGDVPPGEYAIDVLGRAMRFPRDTQTFLEVALTTCSLFLQQRAFWQAFL